MLKKIGALAILGFAIANLTGCWDLPIDPYPDPGTPPGDSTGGGIDTTWTGGGVDTTWHGGGGIDTTHCGRGGGVDTTNGGGGIMPGDTLRHDPADSLGFGDDGGGRGPHHGRGPRRGK